MQSNTTPPADAGPGRFPDFPSPAVLTAEPGAGWRSVFGASKADGRPDGTYVHYRSEAGLVPLFIRTLLPEPAPVPAIRTVHDLATTLLEMRMTASVRRTIPGQDQAFTREGFRTLSQVARREEAGIARWHVGAGL
jgi:hypothetical protein